MTSIASGQAGHRVLSGGYPDGPKPMYLLKSPYGPGSPGKYLSKRKRSYHILGYIRLIFLLKRFCQNTRFTWHCPDIALKSTTCVVRVALLPRTRPDVSPSFPITSAPRVSCHAQNA